MKFALAGNPNSGKTTLFNALTGSSAHVGNWPGVTVDKKDGYYKKDREKILIQDLPGIYSLSPYTPEEIVSRTYILDEKPDLIINIVDATNLERNLYLTTQLMETDRPMVVALNMMDAVDRLGDKIDLKTLEEKLGIPVVGISALKQKGITELMDKAYVEAKKPRKAVSVLSCSPIANIYNKAALNLKVKNIDNSVFHAVKLIEGDELEVKNHPNEAKEIKELKIGYNFEDYDNDYEAIVADQRYKYITANFSISLKKARSVEELTKSDKADKILTHKIWGIPIFLLIMFGVFHIIFSGNFLYLSIYGIEPIESPGVFIQTQLGNLTGWLIELAAGGLKNAPAWVSSLIVDGLLSGIDAVLSFLPQMLLLFLFLSILEDSGYMARVAFIMDRAFRKFGLSGKAFLPLLMCFGCAVPGIMATRTLENEKERRMSITLAPFFSCGAKMPIWAVFAATVFAGRGGEFVVYGMYLLGIVVAILSAILLKHTALKGDTPSFIMELPAYHMPQIKSTGIHLWNKFKHYLSRVTTVIAGAVVVIWFLSSFNFKFQMVEDNGQSIIGLISKGITWLFVPLGFGMGENGWKFVVAAFTGLIAKEMVVATLGVYSGIDDALDAGTGDLAGSSLALMLATLSAPAALSFMAFNLLSVPCMAAVAAANGELKSRKKMLGAILYWLATAYVVSALIYWIGTYWWIGIIVGILITTLLTSTYIKNKKNKYDIKACSLGANA